MKLKDIAHLLPPGAMEVMALLELVGMELETDGANVTDLGWDFPHKQAEMCFETPDGRRLEMTLKEIPNG